MTAQSKSQKLWGIWSSDPTIVRLNLPRGRVPPGVTAMLKLRCTNNRPVPPSGRFVMYWGRVPPGVTAMLTIPCYAIPLGRAGRDRKTQTVRCNIYARPSPDTEWYSRGVKRVYTDWTPPDWYSDTLHLLKAPYRGIGPLRQTPQPQTLQHSLSEIPEPNSVAHLGRGGLLGFLEVLVTSRKVAESPRNLSHAIPPGM